MKNASLSKLALAASMIGSVLGFAADGSAQCATCCKTTAAQYVCTNSTNPADRCDFGTPFEFDRCVVYPGISFEEVSSKRVRIDFNGSQPNGSLPKIAWSLGLTSSGGVVGSCYVELKSFSKGVPKSKTMSSGVCGSASKWIYDATN